MTLKVYLNINQNIVITLITRLCYCIDKAIYHIHIYNYYYNPKTVEIPIAIPNPKSKSIGKWCTDSSQSAVETSVMI